MKKLKKITRGLLFAAPGIVIDGLLIRAFGLSNTEFKL